VLLICCLGQEVTPVIRAFRNARCSVSDGLVMQFNLLPVDPSSCASSPCSQTVPNLSTDQVCEATTNATSPWPLIWSLYAGRNCETATLVSAQDELISNNDPDSSYF
jgi:hypothetical protein